MEYDDFKSSFYSILIKCIKFNNNLNNINNLMEYDDITINFNKLY